jgi:hypothetical protein
VQKSTIWDGRLVSNPNRNLPHLIGVHLLLILPLVLEQLGKILAVHRVLLLMELVHAAAILPVAMGMIDLRLTFLVKTFW